MMRDRMIGSRKGMEMTMSVLVVIVICLVLLVVMIYLLWGRSQTFSASTSCPDEKCVIGLTSKCPGEIEPTHIVCRKEVSGQTKAGRCCPD